MYLTREEEAMLEGEYGEALAKAMRLIVRVGEVLGAERLIKISHAHVSGISYRNIGDAGLEFICSFRRCKVSVYSTFNPTGVPAHTPPGLLGETSEEARRQAMIIDCLYSMGFSESMTCIPYTLREPGMGEHLAWAESSAVAVSNSLYAARTNREGGPVALAAALIGRTYYAGLHLDENRQPELLVKAETPTSTLEAGALGYILGELNKLPYVLVPRLSWRYYVHACAAAASSGSIALIYFHGVSPEARNYENRLGELEKVEVDQNSYREVLEKLSDIDPTQAELYYTGCPHLTPREAEKLIDFLESNPPAKPVVLGVPGYLANNPTWASLAQQLRKLNVYIAFGACIVVSWASRKYKYIATDSLKAAHYLRRQGVKVALATLEDYVRGARR